MTFFGGKRKPLRLIAAILAALILVQETAYSASGGSLSSETFTPINISSISQQHPKLIDGVFGDLDLPENLGKINTFYSGPTEEMVIHIQDLHINESAQLKIARIVHHITSRYGIQLIQLEGATGELAHGALSHYPLEKARILAGRSFLKEGMITGAEYLAISKNKNLILYGVEKKELYDKNREALLKAIKLAEGLNPQLTAFRKKINALSSVIFQSSARSWLERRRLFENNKINISEYTHFLYDLCQEKNLPFEAPQINRVFKMEYLEDKALREQQFETEKELDAHLSKILKEEGGIDTGIFLEIEKIEALLEANLFTEADAQTLYKLIRIINVYEKMFNLALNRDNIEFLYANRKDFNPQILSASIAELADRHKIHLEPEQTSPVKLQETFAAYEEFYKLALDRDDSLVSGAIQSLGQYQKKVSILIAGGFHTPAIEKKLKKEGISFCTITPMIDEAIDAQKDQNLYYKTMKLPRSPASEFLGLTDTSLQLQIPSRLPTLDDLGALQGKKLSDKIASSRNVAYLTDMMLEMGATGVRLLGQDAAKLDLSSSFTGMKPAEIQLAKVYRHVHSPATLVNTSLGSALVAYTPEMPGLSIQWKKAPTGTGFSQNSRQKSFSFFTQDKVRSEIRVLNDPALYQLERKKFKVEKTVKTPAPVKQTVKTVETKKAPVVKRSEERKNISTDEAPAQSKRSIKKETTAEEPVTAQERPAAIGGLNFQDFAFSTVAFAVLHALFQLSPATIIPAFLLMRLFFMAAKLMNEWGHTAAASLKYGGNFNLGNLSGNRSAIDWFKEIFLFLRTKSSPFVTIPQIQEYDSIGQKLYELESKAELTPEEFAQIKQYKEDLKELVAWDKKIRQLGWFAGTGFALSLAAGISVLIATLNPVMLPFLPAILLGTAAGIITAVISDFFSFEIPGIYNCGIFWITIKRLPDESSELYSARMENILQRLAFFMSLYGSHGIGAAIQFEDPETGELDYAHFKMPSGYDQHPFFYQRSGRTAMVRDFMRHFKNAVDEAEAGGKVHPGQARKIRGHVRLKTSGGKVLVETTQPFYINPGHTVRRWSNEGGTMVVKEEHNVAYGAANGDTNAARLPGKTEGAYYTEEEWGAFFERVYGVKVGANDSEKAAYFLYFLRTEGSLADSLRLAFVQTYSQTLNDPVPSLAELQKWEKMLEPLVQKYGTQDWKDSAVMDSVIAEALKLMPQNTSGVKGTAADYRTFLKNTLTAFKENNSYRSARIMMNMVDEFSTYGLFYETSLERQKMVVISREQPVFVAENKTRGIQFGGSNLDFLKWTVRRDPEYAQGDKLRTLTLTMRKERPDRGGEIIEIDSENDTLRLYSMIEEREFSADEVAGRWKDITDEPLEWIAPVLDDFPMMNDLYASLPASTELHTEWRDSTPETSPNLAAAKKFAERWAENAKSFETVNRTLRANGITTPVQHGAPDLFIVVFREENIVVGEWYKKLMKETFPLANIQIVNANDYIRSIESHPLYLNTNTLFLCDNFPETRTAEEHKRRVSQDTVTEAEDATHDSAADSGEMEATWKVIELLHDRKPPHAFVVTPTSENNVSRALDGSRANVISSKLFPDVDGSAGASWTQMASLLELHLYVVKEMRRQFPADPPLGMTLSERDIHSLDAAYQQMISGGLMDILGLGYDTNGEVVFVDTKTHENLAQLANTLVPYFTEQARATAISTIHLLVAVAVTGTLIQLVAALALSGFGPIWGMPAVILSFFSHLLDVPLFLFFKYMTVRLLRWREGREGLYRDQTPAVVIGHDTFGRLLRANLSKMFALAKGIIAPPAIYDARQFADLEGKHGHDARRGTMIILSGPPEMLWHDYVNAGHNGVGLLKKQAESFASLEAVGPMLVGIVDHPDASKYKFIHSAVIHSDERAALREKENFDDPDLSGRILDMIVNEPLSMMAHQLVFVEIIKQIQELKVGYDLTWDAHDTQNSLRATTTAPIRPAQPVWTRGKKKVDEYKKNLTPAEKDEARKKRPARARVKAAGGVFTNQVPVVRSEVREQISLAEVEKWKAAGEFEFIFTGSETMKGIYNDSKIQALQTAAAFKKNLDDKQWGRHQTLAWLLIYALSTSPSKLEQEKARLLAAAPSVNWTAFFDSIKNYHAPAKTGQSLAKLTDEIIAFSQGAKIVKPGTIAKEKIYSGLWHERSGILHNLNRENKLNAETVSRTKVLQSGFPGKPLAQLTKKSPDYERAVFQTVYQSGKFDLSKIISPEDLTSGKIKITHERTPDLPNAQKIVVYRFETGGKFYTLQTFVNNGRLYGRASWAQPKTETQKREEPLKEKPQVLGKPEIERQIEQLLAEAESNPLGVGIDHFFRLEKLQRELEEPVLRSEVRAETVRKESATRAAARKLQESADSKAQQFTRLFNAYKKGLFARILKDVQEKAALQIEGNPSGFDYAPALEEIKRIYLAEIERLKNFSFYAEAKRETESLVQAESLRLQKVKLIYIFKQKLAQKKIEFTQLIERMNFDDLYPAFETNLSAFTQQAAGAARTIAPAQGSAEEVLLLGILSEWQTKTSVELAQFYAERKAALTREKTVMRLIRELKALAAPFAAAKNLSADELLSASALQKKIEDELVKIPQRSRSAALNTEAEQVTRVVSSLETKYIAGLKERYEGAQGEIAELTSKLNNPGESKIDLAFGTELSRIMNALTAEIDKLADTPVHGLADTTAAALLQGEEMRKLRELYNTLTASSQLFTVPVTFTPETVQETSAAAPAPKSAAVYSAVKSIRDAVDLKTKELAGLFKNYTAGISGRIEAEIEAQIVPQLRTNPDTFDFDASLRQLEAKYKTETDRLKNFSAYTIAQSRIASVISAQKLRLQKMKQIYALKKRIDLKKAEFTLLIEQMTSENLYPGFPDAITLFTQEITRTLREISPAQGSAEAVLLGQIATEWQTVSSPALTALHTERKEILAQEKTVLELLDQLKHSAAAVTNQVKLTADDMLNTDSLQKRILSETGKIPAAKRSQSFTAAIQGLEALVLKIENKYLTDLRERYEGKSGELQTLSARLRNPGDIQIDYFFNAELSRILRELTDEVERLADIPVYGRADDIAASIIQGEEMIKTRALYDELTSAAKLFQPAPGSVSDTPVSVQPILTPALSPQEDSLSDPFAEMDRISAGETVSGEVVTLTGEIPMVVQIEAPFSPETLSGAEEELAREVIRDTAVSAEISGKSLVQWDEVIEDSPIAPAAPLKRPTTAVVSKPEAPRPAGENSFLSIIKNILGLFGFFPWIWSLISGLFEQEKRVTPKKKQSLLNLEQYEEIIAPASLTGVDVHEPEVRQVREYNPGTASAVNVSYQASDTANQISLHAPAQAQGREIVTQDANGRVTQIQFSFSSGGATFNATITPNYDSSGHASTFTYTETHNGAVTRQLQGTFTQFSQDGRPVTGIVNGHNFRAELNFEHTDQTAGSQVGVLSNVTITENGIQYSAEIPGERITYKLADNDSENPEMPADSAASTTIEVNNSSTFSESENFSSSSSTTVIGGGGSVGGELSKDDDKELGISPSDALDLLMKDWKPGEEDPLKKEPVPDEKDLPAIPVFPNHNNGGAQPGAGNINRGEEKPKTPAPTNAPQGVLHGQTPLLGENADVFFILLGAGATIGAGALAVSKLVEEDKKKRSEVRSSTAKITWSADGTSLELSFHSNTGTTIQDNEGNPVPGNKLTLTLAGNKFQTADGLMFAVIDHDNNEIFFYGEDQKTAYRFIVKDKDSSSSFITFKTPIENLPDSLKRSPAETPASASPAPETQSRINLLVLFLKLTAVMAIVTASIFLIPALPFTALMPLSAWIGVYGTQVLYWTSILAGGIGLINAVEGFSNKDYSSAEKFQQWTARIFFLAVLSGAGFAAMWFAIAPLGLLTAGLWVLYASVMFGLFGWPVFVWAVTILSLPFRWIPAVSAVLPLKKRALLAALVIIAAAAAASYFYSKESGLASHKNAEKQMSRMSENEKSSKLAEGADKKTVPVKAEAVKGPLTLNFENQRPLLFEGEQDEITVPLFAQKDGNLEMHAESKISAEDWKKPGKAFKVRGNRPLLTLRQPVEERKSSDVQKLSEYLKRVDERYRAGGLYDKKLTSTGEQLRNKMAGLQKDLENYNDKQTVSVFGEIRTPLQDGEEGWILPGQRPLGTAGPTTLLARVHSQKRLTVQASIPASAWQQYDVQSTKIWVTLNGQEHAARIVRLTIEPRLDGQIVLTFGLVSDGKIFDWDSENNRPYPVSFRLEMAQKKTDSFDVDQMLASPSTIRAGAEIEERVTANVNPTVTGRANFEKAEGTWVGHNQVVGGISAGDRETLRNLQARGDAFAEEVRAYLVQLQRLVAIRAVPMAPAEVRRLTEDILLIRETLSRLGYMDYKSPQTGVLVGTFNNQNQAPQGRPVATVLTPQIHVRLKVEKKQDVQIGQTVVVRRRSSGEMTFGTVRQVNRDLGKKGRDKDEDPSLYQELYIETNNTPVPIKLAGKDWGMWFANNEYGIEVIISNDEKVQAWMKAVHAHYDFHLAKLYSAEKRNELPGLFPMRFAAPASEENRRLLINMLEDSSMVFEPALPAVPAALSPAVTREQAGETAPQQVKSANREVQRIVTEANGEQRRQWMNLFLQNQNIAMEDISHILLYGTADTQQMALDYLLAQRRITDLVSAHRILNEKSPELDMTKLSRSHILELLEFDETSLRRLVQLDKTDPRRTEAEKFLLSVLSVKNAEVTPAYAAAARKILKSEFWKTHAEKYAVSKALEASGNIEAARLVRNALFADIASHTGFRLGEPQTQAKAPGPVQRYDSATWDRLHNADKSDADDRWFLTHSPWTLSSSAEPADHFKNRISRKLYDLALKEYEALEAESEKTVHAAQETFSFSDDKLLSDHIFRRLDNQMQREYIQNLSLHGLERFLKISEQPSNKTYRERRGQVINRLLNDKSAEGKFILARVLLTTNDKSLLTQLIDKGAASIIINEAAHAKETPGSSELVIYQLALAKLTGIKAERISPLGARQLALRALTESLSDFELASLSQGTHPVKAILKAEGIPEDVVTAAANEHLSRRATLWAIDQTVEWNKLTLNSQVLTPQEAALKNLKEALSIENFDPARVYAAWSAGMKEHPDVFMRLNNISEFRHEQILKGEERDVVTHLEVHRLSIALTLGIFGLFTGMLFRAFTSMSPKSESQQKRKSKRGRSEVRLAPQKDLVEALEAKEKMTRDIRLTGEFSFLSYENRAARGGIDLGQALARASEVTASLIPQNGKGLLSGEIVLNYRSAFDDGKAAERWIQFMQSQRNVRQLSIVKGKGTSDDEWSKFKQTLRGTPAFTTSRIVFGDEAGFESLETLALSRLKARRLTQDVLFQVVEPARMRKEDKTRYAEFLMGAAPLGKETILLLGSEEPMKGVRQMTLEDILEATLQSYKLIETSA